MNKIIIIFFILFSGLIKGQNQPDSSDFSRWDESAGYYIVNPSKTMSFTESLSKIRNLFNYGSNDEMREYKSSIEPNGMIHKKYQHFKNNIPVYGSQFYIHGASLNNVSYINGFGITRFSQSSGQNIDGSTAINFALNDCKSQKYYWQDTAYENALKEDLNNPNATYFPVPELLYFPIGNSKESEYTLCYKILISSLIPFSKDYYYVNAADGKIIKKISALESCLPKVNQLPQKQTNLVSCSGDCIGGQTNTLYYGTQYINIGKKTFGLDCKYRLRDACNSTVIHTRSKTNISNNSGSFPNFEYTDQTTYFNFLPTTPGGTAHWTIEMTTEFYRSNFNREGMDGGAYPVYAWLNNNTNGSENAFFDRSDNTLNFGTGGGGLANDDILGLDITGHEYTHGISKYEIGFDTYGEPGALNEGLSDIFGKMVENYAKYNHGTPTPYTYVYGADVYYNTTFQIPGGPNVNVRRDFTFPNNSLMPDTYGGTYWLNPNDPNVDEGGKHVNCMVLDYWFYLLAEGGNGINDISNSFCVNSIGKEKAMRIAFHALQYGLGTYSNFSSMRWATEQAASSLYGNTSVELAEVIAAWYAVGVGASPVNSLPFYINIDSKSENANINYNYNSKLRFDTYTVMPNTNVNISSAQEIKFSFIHVSGQFSSNLADIHFKQGSEVHAYIAPANCAGNARMANNGVVNSNPSQNSIENDELSKKVIIQNGVKVYPNPNNGLFTIELLQNSELPYSIEIINSAGVNVLQKKSFSDTKHEIDLEKLQGGLYILKLNYTNKVESFKIVKN